MNMALSQFDFVESCLSKYRQEGLPSGQQWEYAHYPTPKCMGGTEVVRLWSCDHSLQGLLQSEEYDRPCIHTFSLEKDRRNLEHYYPDQLPLLDKWVREKGRRNGKTHIAALLAHPNTFDNRKSTAVAMNAHPATIENRKLQGSRNSHIALSRITPEMCRENGRKGGKKSGKKNASATNAQKWHDPDHPELGQRSPGSLVLMQKRRGYPHGEENRIRVG
jgi:hypothetical protein